MPERVPSEEEVALRKQIAATGAQLTVHCWGDHGQFWSADVVRDDVTVGSSATAKGVITVLNRALKIAQQTAKKEDT